MKEKIVITSVFLFVTVLTFLYKEKIKEIPVGEKPPSQSAVYEITKKTLNQEGKNIPENAVKEREEFRKNKEDKQIKIDQNIQFVYKVGQKSMLSSSEKLKLSNLQKDEGLFLKFCEILKDQNKELDFSEIEKRFPFLKNNSQIKIKKQILRLNSIDFIESAVNAEPTLNPFHFDQIMEILSQSLPEKWIDSSEANSDADVGLARINDIHRQKLGDKVELWNILRKKEPESADKALNLLDGSKEGQDLRDALEKLDYLTRS